MAKEEYCPRSDITYPIKLLNGETWPYTVFLNNVIKHPRIVIGDYTYYNDFGNPKDYARTIAPYLHPASKEMLVIGKYVQMAHGVKFITSSANHQMSGFSTFPFAIFGGQWAEAYNPDFPYKGDTVVGHDVWLGHDAMIMPGIDIGTGAIVGAKSVVTKDVPAYSIVAGNPAKIIRMRFEKNIINDLLRIAWWDWPADKVTRNIEAIAGADIEALKVVA